MNSLPENIRNRLYNMLIEKQSVVEFEKWVYESNELEESISEDSYLDFISLNYKINGAYYELVNLINKQIDNEEYLKWKTLTELNNVKSRKGNYHLSIIGFYDSYCRGYDFIYNLAFEYGLELSCPYSSYGVDDFSELTVTQQENIVESFYPEIINEVEKVIQWINEGKIILKKSTNEFGQLKYIDLREDEETKNTTYSKEIIRKKKNNECLSERIEQKWWEIWK